MYLPFWVGLFFAFVVPAANAQQGESLARCLDKAGFQLAGFEDCKARYLPTCAQADVAAVCYEELAATLQVSARERIAAETLSEAGDLGGGRQTSTAYRKRIATAVFRRALRIGQIDCDFYEATILPAEDGSSSFSKPRCRAERAAAAYWRVIVLRQYYYPKLSTTP